MKGQCSGAENTNVFGGKYHHSAISSLSQALVLDTGNTASLTELTDCHSPADGKICKCKGAALETNPSQNEAKHVAGNAFGTHT